LFWFLQRDFLSLIQEFSGGKLKQKGFFHSVCSSMFVPNGGRVHFLAVKNSKKTKAYWLYKKERNRRRKAKVGRRSKDFNVFTGR
jgi:hypothetical protein